MSFLYVYPDIFSNEDTGLLTGSSPVNEDLGSITLTADSRENLGSITIFTTIPDPYQLPEAYGSIADSVDLTDDYGLITESAFGNYISYGELLENILRIDNLTSARKSTTYRYTTSSIGLFTVEDLGLLGDTVVYEEYGSIADPNAEYDNNGYLADNISDLNPFGTFSAFGGAAEVFGPNPPENTADLRITGDATYSDINREVASGTISAFGGSAESRAYSYNDSSTGSVDYGSLPPLIDDGFYVIKTWIINSVDDYGLITSPVNQVSDYGGILDGATTPYGTIVLSGQKIERVSYSYNESSIYAFGGYEDLGLLSDTVTYEDNGDLTYDYYNSFYDNYGYIVDGESSVSPYGIIRFSGEASAIREGENIATGSGTINFSGDATYKEIDSEVGSGEFSAFGGAAEVYGPNPLENTVLFTISGDATYKEIASEVGSGTISVLSGAAEAFGPNPPENTVLFTISGDATYKEIDSEVGSGTISAFGGSAESRVYSYNDSSSGSDNYGTIVETINSIDDYGLITSALDQIADYGGILDGSTTPYGTIVLSGEKVERTTYSYNESSIYTFGGYEDLGLLSDTVVYEDGGDLTYDYYNSFYDNYGYIVDGESSVSPYGIIRFSGDAASIREGENIATGSGLVEISGNATYKDVNSEVGSGEFSAFGGAAEAFGPNPPENTVLFTISGDATYKEIASEVGSGTITTLSGAAEVYGPNPPENTVDLRITGDATYKDVNSEVGSGTISAFGGAAESRVYSYNDSSTGSDSYGTIVETIDFVDDYGLITSSVDQIADYGGILDGATTPYGTIVISGEKVERVTYSFNESSIYVFGGYEDLGQLSDSVVYEDYGNLESTLFFDQYGYIADAETNVSPYGTIRISGDAVTIREGENIATGSGLVEISGNATYKETNSEVGSGQFSAFGGSVEVYGPNPTENTVLFTISGDATYSDINSEVGSGEFSALSGSAEVFGPNPPENTVLFTISGDATHKEINSEVASGSISAFGGAAESRVYSYNDSSTGSESYGTIVQSIDSVDDYGLITSPVNQIADYGGIVDGATTPYGTLNISGEKIERATYSYNESSIYTFGGYEDLGQLSDTVTYEDYGNLGPTIFFDQYGYIADAETNVSPYGTIRFSGDAITSREGENVIVTSGTIDISGNATYKDVNSEVGSGQFSAFGGSVEVYGPNPPENTVLLTISGDATYKEIEAWNGSGTINTLSGAAQVFGPNPPENAVLFTISGDATYKDINREIGSGSISAFGGSAESRVYSYNDSSTGSDSYGTIVQSIDSVDDYGLITSSVDQISDYGGLLDGATSPYGTIVLSGNATYKQTEAWNGSGSINVSGSATTIDLLLDITSGTINVSGNATYSDINSEVGSGEFSALSGSAEVFGPNPPENTVLFTISGDATYKEIEAWNGSGTINVSGSATIIAPLLNVNSGTIDVSGNATYSDINREIGSGQFSVLSGAAEVKGSNPPENTVLLTISGDATYKQIEAWNGSGTINVSGEGIGPRRRGYDASGTINVSGNATYSDINREIGSGQFSVLSGAAEVKGSNPPENTVLFTISGDATHKEIEAWNGSGTINVSGEGREPRRRGYDGSGSISALSGAAEVKGSNTPDRRVLFTISGDASHSETDVEIGSGNITISGTHKQNVQVYVPEFTGDCEIRITGQGITKQTNPAERGEGTIQIFGDGAWNYTRRGYQGSGSIRTLSGAAIAKGSNPPENTVLLRISGDARSRYFNVYTGPASGTIQISGGITTERQIYVPEFTGTGTIRVAGDGGTPRRRVFIGSGTVSISGAGRQSFTKGLYTGSGSFSIFGGHAEEFGANPPENTVIGNISGSAVLKERSSYRATGIATISGNGAWNYTRRTYQGSGTLRTLSGAAVVKVSNPLENTALFTISGAARQKVRFTESGIGTARFSGSAIEKDRSSNVGIGTLNLSGAATSIAKINRFVGSGVVQIGGQRIQKRTFAYNGSGTLSAIRGSAESFGANPPENIAILTIGGAADTRYFNVYTGPASGKIEISGGITTERQIYVPEFTGSGTVRVSGDAATPRGRFYDSSGTIRILGSAKESYTRTTYIGSGEINISGIGTYEYREYQPPFVYVTII